LNGEASLWIFGYGSLIWSPAFPFQERVVASAQGWTRRFYQGSPDHRGTPLAPGRVVTLVPAPDERCWGVAYRVAGDQVSRILEALDQRESAGYERVTVSLDVPSLDAPLEALTYAAGPNNPQYLGQASLVEMAAQMRACSGPSGRNRDYLTALAEALRDLQIRDAHVESLERELVRHDRSD